MWHEAMFPGEGEVPARTVRGRQNAYYATLAAHALGVAGDDDDMDAQRCRRQFAWIFGMRGDEDGLTFYRRTRARRTILSELGRIGDRDALRYLADILCRLKPKTTQAVVMIRQWRRGRRPEAKTVRTLHKVIVRAIGDFLATYPETEPALALLAVELAAKSLRRMIDEPARQGDENREAG